MRSSRATDSLAGVRLRAYPSRDGIPVTTTRPGLACTTEADEGLSRLLDDSATTGVRPEAWGSFAMSRLAADAAFRHPGALLDSQALGRAREVTRR
jgi:hypothetical protein